MAYIKYKELTKYFYFRSKIDSTTLPKYITDYVDADEEIIAAYTTKRDRAIFTDKKIVLFDVKGFSLTKQVHTIPYTKISTIAILYRSTSGDILLYTDSGYPLKLKFVNLKNSDKTELRILYSKISKIIRQS